MPIEDWIENKRLVASDGASYDCFGISVSINGDYAIVGARDDDNEKGSAYIFKRSNTTWYQENKLTASDGLPGDWFGISVAVYSDYVFVGADADDNSNGVNAGSVYVFKYNGSGWNQYSKLIASDGVDNDYFGRSVSIDKDYAVIGAYYDNSITGSAYVFKISGGNWIEEYKLTASDGQPGDYFGVTTTIEDEYIITGAYRDDNSNGLDAGSVYVFKRNNTSWIEEAKLIASDGSIDDRFGIEVSIEGDYILVGAYYDNSYTGSAYVFKKIGNDWIETQKLTALNGNFNNFFGRSVSIDENNAIIGAWGYNNQTGAAYVFELKNGSWIEYENLVASDYELGDRFAYQVSIDGDYAVIGAYMADNENGVDAGSAYIFKKNKIPDLECQGSLIWTDVRPGKKVNSNFKIINKGTPGSLLEWEIIERPPWGIWTINPDMGDNLTPESSPLIIETSVVAPVDPKTEFSGELKIINKNDLSNYCIVPIYLKTQFNRPFGKMLYLDVVQKLRQRSLFFW